ncbi:DSD1 family PLP-dependent enzyme [Paucibacter sp. R3-3]|uniref:DSD1 family PLP-dependent enzyme n=1 Tax=Roseateles agri TaxID=3098619 RepID=A0ABU5DFE3_9BURK|nr:DSD1 family PLP-dependent enzyme [Paucibacter sp. R3-3]MDY0744998.1 DSD1 family PLP-dependent enzyme [Paucibacter sp. R3-3]
MSTDSFPTLPPAARVGDPLERIDTPALVLDLDAFERNLDLMQAKARAAGVALRPHAKAHKTPQVALAQIARGAVGICCQKVSEALPFLEAGVTDIHISNEVVGAAKLALLAQAARVGRFSVCVDDAGQVAELAAACAAQGSRVDVFVEINVGQDRCGVAGAPEVLSILQVISAHPQQLAFKGLQAYQGRVQHIRSREERRAAALAASARTAAVVAALQAAGIACPVVTGGGSGSVEFELAGGIYNEVQPGSSAFMDADYGANEYGDALRFEHSLFVLASVMSRVDERQAIVDAGLKSMSAESGLPRVWGRQGVEYAVISDEHGNLRGGAPLPQLGERVLLVPGHCDPTFNLHDELVCLRGGVVEAIWPVAARGLSR